MANANLNHTFCTEGFRLIDAREMGLLHPATFWVPPADQLSKLAVGDLVKLGFEVKGYATERMWVRITTRIGDNSFVGTLTNTPVEHMTDLDKADSDDYPLYYGAQVYFDACNVMDIDHEDH